MVSKIARHADPNSYSYRPTVYHSNLKNYDTRRDYDQKVDTSIDKNTFAAAVLTTSICVSSIALIVFAALTMTGIVTPLIGGSIALGVGALTCVIESILAAKIEMRMAFRLIKIALGAIYCTLAVLTILGILTPSEFAIGIFSTLGGGFAAQMCCAAIPKAHETHQRNRRLNQAVRSHNASISLHRIK